MDFLWLALGLTTADVGGVGLLTAVLCRCVKSCFDASESSRPKAMMRFWGLEWAAWLEKGWYSPTDLPVLRRLHRGLLSGKFEGLLSEDELKKYRTLVRRAVERMPAFWFLLWCLFPGLRCSWHLVWGDKDGFLFYLPLNTSPDPAACAAGL